MRGKYQVGFCVLAMMVTLSGCQATNTVKRITEGRTTPEATEVVAGPVTGAVEAGRGEGAAALAPALPPVEEAAPRPRLFRGTGELTGTAVRSDAFENLEGDIFLNFADAEVAEVVDVVLGEILGLNYAVDPGVQGRVTLETSRPIARDAVLPVLEQVLGVQGVAIVEVAGFYRVLPMEAAGRSSAGLSVGRVDRRMLRGFRSEIVALDHIGAGEMQKLLQPFVPPGRTIIADPARNVLILTGTSGDVAQWSDMIASFDVDWLAGMSFGIFPVVSTDAETMAADLNVVFSEDEGVSPLAGLVRILPLNRMNAVLVAAKRPDYLDRVGEWVERLDWSDTRGGKRLYVYHVENRRAGDIAPILSAVFGQTEQADASAILSPAVAGTAQPSQNRRAPASAETASVEAVDVPAASDAAPEPPVAGSAGVGAGLAVRDDGAIRIIADEKMNALLILATPADYRLVQGALEKLDVVPLQVLIEATILEVRLTDELEFGVQWFYESGNHGLNLSQTAAEFAGGVSSAGFSYFFTTDNLRFTVSALDSVTDVKVMSSPHMMVLDNETARLQVGAQVPVATQSAVDISDPDAPIVNSIQLLDTGVILEVTPRVNANGLVSLDIRQEVSDAVATESSGIDSPTIQITNVESSVSVQSGETVALGGLIRDSDARTESGVPVLMDVPLLGNFFKTTNDTLRRTELLVLLTPRVVRDQTEAREVTEELRRKLPTLRRLNESEEP